MALSYYLCENIMMALRIMSIYMYHDCRDTVSGKILEKESLYAYCFQS